MTKGSFGELLKRERELREVTLNEVTVATRIPPRFLEAFEREEWEKLPGGVFNRGFVRAIARYLGLDEENLLSEYDLAYGEQHGATPIPVENPIPAPPKWSVAAATVVILLLVGGALWGAVSSWHRYSAWRAAKRAALTASATPGQATAPGAAPASGPNAASPTAKSSSANAGDPPIKGNPSSTASTAAPSDTNSAAPQRLDLAVSTSGQTRVRVVADGRVVLDSHLPAGETRRLFARNQFIVSAAHPDAVLLEMNGQPMPSLTSVGSGGTMVLSQKDLRQAPSGNAQR